MGKYIFEVDAYQEIEVEANNLDEARMKLVNCEVDSIKNCSCNDLNIDCIISDGVNLHPLDCHCSECI